MYADFDRSDWKNVLVADYSPKMVSQQTEPLRMREEIPVVTYSKNEKGNWVYDLGQNFSGVIRLCVKGRKRTECTSDTCGITEPESHSQSVSVRRAFYFTYKLRGGQCIETWQPQFTYYGFRYVEVEGAIPAGEENPDKLPVIMELAGVHTCLAAPETGSFSCSNPLFNKIHNLIDWAMRSNMPVC